MSYRSRVYRTNRLKNGDRVVSSMKTGDYFLWQIIKWIFKGFLFIMFFWIIIPFKLIFRKK